MARMQTSDIWILTVSFYNRAVDAGVEPRKTTLGEALASDDPGRYVAKTFYFNNPPSRQEFLEVVESLPWAWHSWKDTLLPILDENPWVMVDYMHKAGFQEIVHEGKVVGSLDVHSYTRYCNKGIDRLIAITVDIENKAIRHIAKDKKEQAKDWIRENENLILERSQDIVTDQHLGSELDDIVAYVIDTCLYEQGFRKSKPKNKLAGVTT